jgi:hypothetical protein
MGHEAGPEKPASPRFPPPTWALGIAAVIAKWWALGHFANQDFFALIQEF